MAENEQTPRSKREFNCTSKITEMQNAIDGLHLQLKIYMAKHEQDLEYIIGEIDKLKKEVQK